MKRHHDDTTLNAEERALAAQLHRLPPHGEPDAGLDARILAMARAAAQARRATPTRRHWPAYASAAAVCVLTAGLAWQLWPAHVQRGPQATPPVPAPAPAPAEPVAAVIAPPKVITDGKSVESATDATANVDAAAPRDTPRVPLPPQPPRPPISARGAPTPQPPIMTSTADASGYSAPAPATSGVVVPPPSPPAPPAPPAPPKSDPPLREAASAANAAAMAAPAAVPAESAAKAREAKTATPAMNAMRVQSAADTENGYDARPPATVQDSNVRSDWLKRIRELMAQGDRDGARSSLQEYKTRYPDATIPADLQPLLAAPPPKSP